MTRTRLMAFIRSARTLEQLEACMAAITAWLRTHPDDDVIREEAESVYMGMTAIQQRD